MLYEFCQCVGLEADKQRIDCNVGSVLFVFQDGILYDALTDVYNNFHMVSQNHFGYYVLCSTAFMSRS